MENAHRKINTLHRSGRLACWGFIFIALFGFSHAEEPLKLDGQWNEAMPAKSFTAEEWKKMTEHDEVEKFIKRVNDAAVAKDYWKSDFRRAFYDAFHEEYGKRAMEKYNDGKPFMVRGEVE